jgi:hypothetical protein
MTSHTIPNRFHVLRQLRKRSPRLTLTLTQLINKVAGLYGLVTLFVGGSFTQLLFYAYSLATLFGFLWMLKIVKSVSEKTSFAGGRGRISGVRCGGTFGPSLRRCVRSVLQWVFAYSTLSRAFTHSWAL